MLPSAVNLAPCPTAQHCYRDPNPLSISPQSFIITTATSFLYCSHSSKHHNVETNSVALQHTRWSETNSSLATATEQWIRSKQRWQPHVRLYKLWSSSSFLACDSRLLSAIRRHHPPQRAVLSQICCFGERKMVMFRSCWMVLSHVMRGRPSYLLQSAGAEANRILLASALSSMRIICPNKVSRHDWIIAVSLGCFLSLRTSSALMGDI